MELPTQCDLAHHTTILIICLSIAFIFIPWLLCLLDRSGTGTGGHPLRWRLRDWTSSARQATPPLIMSIKTQFPLFLAYAWIGWSPCVYSTASLNPYPLHGLSSCHSSKQTTILADIGVVCDHVAPAIATAYCMLKVYNVVVVVVVELWVGMVVNMVLMKVKLCRWIHPNTRWTMRGCVGVHSGLSHWTSL